MAGHPAKHGIPDSGDICVRLKAAYDGVQSRHRGRCVIAYRYTAVDGSSHETCSMAFALVCRWRNQSQNAEDSCVAFDVSEFTFIIWFLCSKLSECVCECAVCISYVMQMLNDVLLPFYYCWGYFIHFLLFHTIFSSSRSPIPSCSISIFIYFLFCTDDALLLLLPPPLLLLLVFILYFFFLSENEFYENIIEMKILHAQFTYINRCLIRLHVRNSYSQSDFPRQKTEKVA